MLDFISKQKLAFLRWYQVKGELNAFNMNLPKVIFEYPHRDLLVDSVQFDTLRVREYNKGPTTGTFSGPSRSLHEISISDVDWKLLKITNCMSPYVERVKWYHLRYPIITNSMHYFEKTKTFLLGLIGRSKYQQDVNDLEVLDTLYDHEFHRDTLTLFDMSDVYDLPDKMKEKPKCKFAIKKLTDLGYLTDDKLTTKGYERRETLRTQRIKSRRSAITIVAVVLAAVFAAFAVPKDSFLLQKLHITAPDK